jgi:hypothetical protein
MAVASQPTFDGQRDVVVNSSSSSELLISHMG